MAKQISLEQVKIIYRSFVNSNIKKYISAINKFISLRNHLYVNKSFHKQAP